MATLSNAELVAQVYVGFYDRAPDPVGLQYWTGRLDAGVSIQDIGDSFAASPEASDTYPFFKYPDLLSQNDFLAQVYQNVFGRAIDADGLAYYSARMEAGESAGSVVASILGNAASNDGSPDQAFLQNKVDAGLHWALEAAATNANVYQENGRLTDSASDSAHAILDGITADPASVEAANAASDAYFNGDNPGGIFTLTNAANFTTGGVDVVQGTNGADNIRAILGGSLDSADIIDGGAGNDVLNISLGGLVAGAAPVITSVETINDNDGGGLDLGSVTGVVRINASVAASYTNAHVATIIGADGTTVNSNITIDYVDSELAGASTIALAANSTFDTGFIFDASDAATIENVSVALGADNTGQVHIDASNILTAVESVTVTGSGDAEVFLHGAVATVESFDSSAATGDITVDLSGAVKLETITTGSGIDLVTFDSAEDVVVNTGAGADEVTVGAAGGVDGAVINTGAGNDIIDAGNTLATDAITINAGAGADSITLGGAGDANLVYTAQSDSTYVNFDTITGFTTTQDTIDLSAFHLTGDATVGVGDTTQTTIGGLSNGATNFFGTHAVVTFTDGTDNYVFADLNNDGNFDAAHDLVILTGTVVIADADLVL